MASKNYAFSARDSVAGGVRKCGLTPTWVYLVLTSNWSTAVAGPTITETTLVTTPASVTPTTATSGGTILAGTYPTSVTYVNNAGETVGSTNVNITTTGTTSTITIPSPATNSAATGWYAYVGQIAGAAGSGTRQQAAGSPTLVGTALTLTVPPTSTGATLPSTNTTSGGQYHFTYDAAVNGEVTGQIDCGAGLTYAADRYIDVIMTV